MNSWYLPLDKAYEPDRDCMLYFDQNGYDLTPLEYSYSIRHNVEATDIRWRKAICQDWFTDDVTSGVHINHAALFERKSFQDEALEQIKSYATNNNTIYKLVHMKSKWGIDISIDYVDQDKAFEVFHYEWDDFNYEVVLEKQLEIEEIVLSTDWENLSKIFWNRRDEWLHLDFDGQTKYKTDYLGLSPERFKLVAWTV